MLKHDDMNDGRYISSTDAAFLYGCSKDYISRLCRSGKLKGNLLGRNWFIEVDSFGELLAQKDVTKAETLKNLSEQRKREYAEARENAEAILQEETVSDAYVSAGEGANTFSAVESVEPLTVTSPTQVTFFDEAKPRQYSIFHNVTALVLSVSLVFGVYGMIGSSYPSKALNEIVALSHDAKKLFSGDETTVAESPVSASASYLVASVGSLTTSASDFFGKSPDADASLFARAFARLTSSLSNTNTATSKSAPSSTFALVPLPKSDTLGRQVPSGAPVTPAQTITRALATSYQPAPKQSVYVTNITKTETISGVSQAYVDSQLQILKNSLSSDIFKFTSAQYPSAPGISQSTANLAVSSRIDRLNHATIENSAFNNGTITGSTFSGGSITDTSISATELSVSGTATFAGGVNLSAGTLTLPYFNANSTTTPSYVAYRLGIGTTSPYRDLSVAGSGVFGGDILAGTLTATTSVTSPNLILSSVGRNMILAIDASGNVFATSTPSADSFFATSTSATSTFAGGFVAGNGVFNILQSGLVGLGTTSPSASFAVQGNSYVSGTSFFGGPIVSTSTFTVAGGSSFAGFVSTASSTIGNGNQNGGLTIFGGATTTGNAYFASGLGVGVATTTPGALQTSGDVAVGGNLYVVGNSTTLGNSSSNTLTINSSINSSIVPNQNITYDLGSASYYWRNVYVGTITANNISAGSSTISGTASQTFTINSDNATSDTEDADIIFFRGNVVPNALLSWKTGTKRFEFNQSTFIQNASTDNLTGITLDLKGQTGQTGDLFRISSSTGTNLLNITSAGLFGLGSTTPSQLFSVQGNSYVSGTSFFGGAVTATSTLTVSGNTTLANATSTAFFATTASSTNLFAQTATLGTLTAQSLSVTETTAFTGLSTFTNGFLSQASSTVTGGLFTANGGLFSTASSTIGAGTQTTGLTINGGATTTGNLVLSGLGARILGDYSNATIADRVAFQSNVTNGNTNFSFLPNGTAVTSAINAYNNSDPTNAAYANFGINSVSVRINSDIRGTGTYLPMAFFTGGPERMRLDTSGNLGIGTTTPTNTLAVHGTSYVSGTSFFGGAITATSTLTVSGVATLSGGFTAYASSTIGDGTQTGGLTINGGATTTGNAYFAGNVGIGTAAPAAKLHLSGNVSSSAWSTNGVGLRIDAATYTDTTGVATFNSGIHSFGLPTLAASNAITANTANNVRIAAGVSAGSNITITDSYGLNIVTAALTGTVGRATALTVAAPTGATNNYAAYFSSGNVGIGDGTPAALLTVGASDAFQVNSSGLLLIPAGASGAGNLALSTTGDTNTGLYFSAADELRIQTGGSDRLTINSSGNVGIGTTTPSSTFSVQGNAYTSGTSFFGGAITATSTLAVSGATTLSSTLGVTGLSTLAGFISTASSTIGAGTQTTGLTIFGGATTTGNAYIAGNVGIGTTTPGSTLSVAGNAYTSGFYNTSASTGGYKMDGNSILYASSTTFSTFVGQSAGGTWYNATSTAGLRTTAMGYFAAATTPVSGAALDITAFGYRALAANTGDGNAAFGGGALTGNTTGVENVAFGSGALSSNTTGSYNIAIGGRYALDNNRTGSYNVAIGRTSLDQSTTGTENVAVGMDTSRQNTSATSSVAIGASAAYGVGGVYNAQGYTAVGYRAGYNFQTGADYNTFLGYGAGNLITTGSKNIVLGAASTLANSNITTGSNNILIGNDVKIPVATNSNQINLANILFGTNNSTTGGTYATGQLGVGSTSPYARFSIHANNGDTNTTLFAIASSTATATTTLFAVTNAGYVGIGTGAPGSPFEISNTASQVANFKSTNNNAEVQIDSPSNAGSGLFLAENTSRKFGLIYNANITSGNRSADTFELYSYTTATPIIRVHQSAGTTLVIDSNSNVGIGTTTPSSTFSVQGNAYVSGTSFFGGAITATSTLTVSGATTLSGGFTAFASSTIGDGTQAGGLTIFGGATTTGNAYFAGNVGVGTAAPAVTLDVQGTSNQLRIGTGAANSYFIIDAQPNVYTLKEGASATEAVSFNKTSHYINFTTNSAEAVRITSTGNVGIGTTTPSSTFSVQGNAYVSGTSFFGGAITATSTFTFNIPSGNDVLIKNGTNPFLAASSTIFSTFLGSNAGLNVRGANNTAVGFDALRYATSSTNNTALGYMALRRSSSATADNSGGYNTGVGVLALAAVTSGASNTGIGYQSFTAVTTGDSNIGVGVNSGQGTVDGIDNVVVGTNAFRLNISGSRNIALGSGAQRNTTGSANIAIGSFVDVASTTLSGQLNIGNVLYGSGLYNNNGNQSSSPTATGAIGIGTTTPWARLSVEGISTLGNQAIAGYFTATSTTASSFAGGLTALASTTIGAGTQTTGLTIYGGATTTGNAYFAGNVGIGTTSPAATLGVTGSIYSTLAVTAGGGKVILGTDSNGQIELKGTTAGVSQPYFDFGDSSAKDYDFRLQEVSASALFSIGASTTPTAFNILSSGNIGVGTTTPSSTFSVQGNAYTSGISFFGGAITATSTLDVTGTINTSFATGGYKMGGTTILTASSTSFSTHVGLFAGDAESPGIALYNTTLGYDAMTAATSSKGNVGIGYYALRALNDTADASGSFARNTAVGYTSLYANTTGYYNTAIGGNAMQNNTTGYGNSAVGNWALYSNTTAQYNTAQGYEALLDNTTGARNTAVGGLAALNNDTGSDNTAFGYEALYVASSSAAIKNTAIGSLAGLYASTTGSTFVGYRAGSGASTAYLTGANNTLIGYISGFGITSGANNVLLGASSISASYNQITTGSQNISIGYNVAVADATASGQLNIGNFLYGTGLTGTGSTISGGSIGLGVKAPQATLQISTTTAGATTHALILQNRSSTISTAVSLDFITTAGDLSDQRYNSIKSINTDGGTSADLTFNLSTGAAPTERMRITSAGLVGIGTTSPTATFQVQRAGSFTGSVTSDVVGVFGNTTAASTPASLSIVSGSTGISRLQLGGDGAATYNNGRIAYDASTNAMGLWTLDTERLTIDSSGYVGIGTTTPGSTLSVAGNIFSSGFHDTSASTGGYKIDGSTVLYASSTSFSVFLGIRAGGLTAATNLLTGNDTGIGYGALQNDLSGSNSRNTAVGSLAGNIGSSTASFIQNTFIGTFAGQYASTTGSTFLGYSAGGGASTAYVTGGYNTLLGYATGGSITSGSSNIVIGPRFSPQNNEITTGSGNVSIGSYGMLPSATANYQLDIQNIIYGTNNSGNGTAYSTGQIGIGSTSPYARFSIQANNGDTNTTLFAIGSSTPTATTTLFAVTNAGNVGIGTSTPRGTLEIVDTSTPSDAATAVLTVHGRSSTPYLAAFFNDAHSKVTPGLQLFQFSSAPTGSATGIAAGDFVLANTAANKLVFSTNGYTSPRMVVTGTGLVGIGTTSPTESLLTVATPMGATGSVLNLFRIASSTASATTTLFNVNNQGDVAIVTSSGSTANVSGFNVNGGGTLFQAYSSGVTISRSGTSNSGQLFVQGSANAASAGTYNGLVISTGISSTAGAGTYSALKINPTLTVAQTSGTGLNYLISSFDGTTASTSRGFYQMAGVGAFANNIGMGSTSPFAKLSIHAQNGDSNPWLFAIASSTASATSTLFMVDSTGKVGIGTTTPDSLITVTANTGISGGAAATHGVIQIQGSADINSGTNGLEFKAASSGAGYGWLVTSPDRGNANVPLSFASRSGVSTWTERMTLRSDTGNVGIGTTTPYAKLSVTGAGSTTGVNFQTTDSSNSPLFTIFDSGKIGIGTSSPNSTLSVRGGSAATASNAGAVQIGVLPGASSGGLELGISTVTGPGNIGSMQGFSFLNGANAAIALQPFGGAIYFNPTNVSASTFSFATTSTAYKFNITGTSGSGYLAVSSSAPGDIFNINSSGDIGIGTTTPGAKLDVYNGAVCVDDATPTCQNAARTAGTIYAVATAITGIDLAERYPTKDANLGAGEIVGFDPANPVFVAHATSPGNFLGVVSTAPGIVLGGYNESLYKDEKKVPVALAGRVPVKVNLEGGDINVGDVITLSSVAGVGAKATTTTQTIGVALEPYTQAMATSTTGLIQVFIKPELTISAPDRSKLADVLSESATTTAVNLAVASEISSFSATLRSGVQSLGDMVVKVFNSAVYASTGIFNKVFAKEVHTDTLCVSDTSGETCITKAQLDALLAGAVVSQGGGSGSGGSGSGSGGDTGTTTPDTIGPVIELLGANPATVSVGSAYVDLGATVTDNVSQNLGYTVSLNGATSTEPSSLTLDTSVAGEHNLVFTAIDQAGNTGMATRTIIVE